ncbi:hypothetical protein NHX12_002005 [Muraenolepis orangiensis]|uniref:Protein MMS22-like n=1 Tax=Muraenolepis orangiensis TaxID=630683 RepID=A0A9Q0IH26_9TELE|nr:hypothetical protein NHX12_002005 [Muraenolepis orangiensis]
MTEEFSQSLTPPVSPLSSTSDPSCEPTRFRPPPRFSCASAQDGSDPASLSSEGYMEKGTMKRLLLRLDPAPADYEEDTVEIFGFPWVTETALVESTKILFGLLRQKLFRLEALVQASSHDFGQAGSLHYEAEDLRQQCVLFLQYVKVFLHRYLEASSGPEDGPSHPYEEQEAQLPSALLEELFGLTLLIGRLKDLPANLQSALTMQNQGKIFPPAWHLLHLHLDIHWSVLEVLHLLGQKMHGQVVYAHQFVNLTGENLTDCSLFEAHLCGLLCDLTGLAMGKYSKVRPTEALSFWSYMNQLLQPLVMGRPPAEQYAGLPAHCKDPLGFTWWLVTHLAELGRYSRNGKPHGERQLEANWSFVEDLLKTTCNPRDPLPEEQVRMHVLCCLSLCLQWGPSTAAVSTLWDYYSRNLSAPFSVPWLGVSGLGTVCRTPLALLEHARDCCNPAPLRSPGHTQLYRSATSFHIFLRVLGLCLAQDSGSGAPRRQMKGRIYSKFSAKKMQDLSEAGLMHFLLLFMVVARQVELEDVAGRACELLGHLPATCSPGHRSLVWRGQLALLLLFQERSLDVGAQASWLASSFNETAKEFYDKTTEASRRLALWGPLGSYLEGVAEVFETSASLALSEEKLLSEGFDWLLPACRQSELNSALSFLQIVLSQLRSPGPGAGRALSRVTGSGDPVRGPCRRRGDRRVFLSLRGFSRRTAVCVTHVTPPVRGFTLLAFDLPSSAPHDLQPGPVQSIMLCFGWDDMLHPLLVTRYLPHLLQNRYTSSRTGTPPPEQNRYTSSRTGTPPPEQVHLLQNSELVSALSSGPGSAVSGSGQALSVRAWFRCVLQQHLYKNPDGSDSRAGRAAEEQLAELTRLVLRLPDVDALLQRAGLQPPAGKQEPNPALELFIKAVGRVYGGLQVLSERSAMVGRALDYMGDVLKYIKPYLVSKNQEGMQLAYWAVGCVVKHWSPLLATSKAQQLLFRIVDGLLLPHSLTQQHDRALRSSLPLYLQGLSVACSVSQSQGVYLKKQLCTVIGRYLDHFLPATPSTAAVANHPVLLGVCESSPSPRGAGLRRTTLQVLCDRFLQFKVHAPPPRLLSLLAFLLELLRRNGDTDPLLLTVPLPSLLRCVMLALQLVVERCSASSSPEPCGQMISVLRTFVEENEGVYERLVYSALETVAILDPRVVGELVPNLSAYKKLLAHLGESGQAETVSLDQD